MTSCPFNKNANVHITVLTLLPFLGEEERHYWKKIEEGRQKKRQTATRQRNRRHAATAPQSKSAPLTSAAASAVSSGAAGRGKGSHIRFDDEDDQVE